jgi:hypothetical protein
VITHASHPQVVTIPRGRERRIRQAECCGEVGRRAFVSGKRKQNTIKTTTIADKQPGHCGVGAVRPGRMHDQTAVKTEGIADLLSQYPHVQVTLDDGYRGLATAFPDQVHAPPANRPRTHRPSRSPSTSRYSTSSRPGGSASSMPWLNISSGGRCSAGSAVGSTTARSIWRSLDWSPIGPLAAGSSRREWRNG